MDAESSGWPFDLGFPDVEWAMQIAVRYDKQALPTHLEVCAAAAKAVVGVLADPRATGDGPWAAQVQHWRHGRIRKLVRRARGLRWEEVQELPGISVRAGWQDRAQVRAFVPAPARPLPPELDRLQVSGTHFPDDVEGREEPPQEHAVPLITIALTPHAVLSTGKAAAQCGHAAQLAWEALTRTQPEVARRWHAEGARVRVVQPDVAGWRALAAAPVRVVDAGLTEVDGPTESARAWW
ncbi:MAG: peptidyl-tRNA hydrolase [Austwickia sp.]|jgi:peptidyl-tRNA hydrolase|nr:peptidyl-tRNA hydrolase [Austwickia sp.]MBK8435299.1 peptidyl-tRNA hydrolase [Austwickia sp.]MBK9101149.1 peptidyl-tRNA hydrolase [Austwickia sp.]